MDYDVKKLLPHREPFLFIDEVLEVDEKSIVAKWFVSPDEDFFKGHFPDFPIMPGVLVLEAMAQSTGVLGSHIMKQTANKNSVYLLCGIEKTRLPTTGHGSHRQTTQMLNIIIFGMIRQTFNFLVSGLYTNI